MVNFMISSEKPSGPHCALTRWSQEASHPMGLQLERMPPLLDLGIFFQGKNELQKDFMRVIEILFHSHKI
jgi:hypothetical protein